jgi:hypothetical protein
LTRPPDQGQLTRLGDRRPRISTTYATRPWRERAEAALEGALKEREAESEGPELAAALRRIGELSMEVELLRAKMGQTGSLARKRVRDRSRSDVSIRWIEARWRT